MKILAIDGNSILNRAFYGIRALSTKDGRFTNGIYGFMTILMKLRDEVNPDGVAIAFDLKAPTFRHKMYDGYKANRHGMPPELAQQLPVLKELLTTLGYKIVTLEGYEADDILGTVAGMCQDSDECFIATGDRDSFQLIRDNVTVLLPHTKMGKTTTEIYTPKRLLEEYGVEPLQMIDIKALQGDTSDCIPGVAGVGQKTAGDLIQKFGSIQNIYDNIDTLEIKENLKNKLVTDKEKAFLSYTLGKIIDDAPIDCTLFDFVPASADEEKARTMLADLEMFKIIEKLEFSAPTTVEKKDEKVKELGFSADFSTADLLNKIKAEKEAYFTVDYKDLDNPEFCFLCDNTVYHLEPMHLGYFDFVKAILEDEKIKKYTDNSKLLYRFAFLNKIEIKGMALDTSLAGYILNPSANGYSPLRLCEEYKAPIPKVQSDLSLAQDCAVMKSVSLRLKTQIESNNQEYLLYNVEMPLAEVLASMEHLGFMVDRKGIAEFTQKISGELKTIQQEIYDLAGEEFNINSPKQLGVILFEKMGLPAKKKTKSGYSTNADVLESLQNENPIIEKILWFRTLSKLYSTYCEGLLKVIGEDGRIHSSFIQTETRTGRISSTEPNLQNIPVRKEIGREMRKFFVAKEGSLLADADYSQIELRVLAHIADDEEMLKAFNNEVDIHTVTASQVFNMPLEMVTPLMRSRAKAVNFGIVYGIGAFSLAKDIGVTRKEADEYIKGYLRLYSGVDKYMETVVADAKEKGYVSTLWERRRYLPELSSSNGMLRAFGERVARNMPIQGTAADIIKIAMVKVYNRLKAENMQAKLILQVHDELIVEAPENEIEKAAKILSEEMENACQMKVRLRADVNTGKTWYQAKG
ncbi:MAG: DNA polymerase I [Clostridia bacterium]|nr:DNA polymerase I [Clostridia bacterium]